MLVDGKDFNVSVPIDTPPTSSGLGLLTPVNDFEVCFVVTIFGDNVLEDAVETANLLVMAGSIPVTNINILIEDDDSSKLTVHQSWDNMTIFYILYWVCVAEMRIQLIV